MPRWSHEHRVAVAIRKINKKVAKNEKIAHKTGSLAAQRITTLERIRARRLAFELKRGDYSYDR